MTYLACALIFQKKGQSKSEEKSLAKGLILKRVVQLYTLVLAAYLTLVFLLMISYQLDSYWGSRLLLVILTLNFMVPIIAFSLISRQTMNKMMTSPSGIDQFMIKKGKHTTFKQARSKHEFWLFLFTFSIIIGIARMVDENATIIALHNSQKA